MAKNKRNKELSRKYIIKCYMKDKSTFESMCDLKDEHDLDLDRLIDALNHRTENAWFKFSTGGIINLYDVISVTTRLEIEVESKEGVE